MRTTDPFESNFAKIRSLIMMTEEHSSMAMNAISHEANMARGAVEDAAAEYQRHSVLFRPRIFIDGNKWCALYGENLQDGVAGFGDSPAEAMKDFDRNFTKKLGA